MTRFSVVLIPLLLVPFAQAQTRTDLFRSARNWAYQLQGLEEEGAVDALVAAPYDVLVLEPTRSEQGSAFGTALMVSRLHASSGLDATRQKLVLAYVDIGEAEDWRWYWEAWWVPPTATSRGTPDFLVTADPDDWQGNYPVAYWDSRWHEIIVTGTNSALRQALDDGFDGIYMDWVEAYDNAEVIAAAQAESIEPVQAMIDFITLIRTTARATDPDFLIVPQNAVSLAEGHPSHLTIIDGIGVEDINFSGLADTAWGDPGSGDIRTPDPDRLWYHQQLSAYRAAGLPVFAVDYALIPANIEESYSLLWQHGYKAFVSQTPLDRLPTFVSPPTLTGALAW